jgi:hypothetical protein
MIINNTHEADGVVEKVKKMLKASVFVPLKHIVTVNEA